MNAKLTYRDSGGNLVEVEIPDGSKRVTLSIECSHGYSIAAVAEKDRLQVMGVDCPIVLAPSYPGQITVRSDI